MNSEDFGIGNLFGRGVWGVGEGELFAAAAGAARFDDGVGDRGVVLKGDAEVGVVF